MRLLSSAFFAFALIAFTACTGSKSTAVEEVVPAEVENSFGAGFEADEVVLASALLASYDEQSIADTVSTTIRGTVDEVCQAKGCWMTIAAGDDAEMMVKFKDYGFFMPKDISGREVIMNGIAFYEVTPVDELRHYAEDAGKTAEEIAMITEPKRELKFLADGVQLVK